MNALDHYYDDAVCTAETIEEMNQLLKEKSPSTPKGGVKMIHHVNEDFTSEVIETVTFRNGTVSSIEFSKPQKL